MQVLEVIPEDGQIHVCFMAKQGAMVYWGLKPDESWEDLAYFVDNSCRVSVLLNEACSTHRKLLFYVVYQ